MKVAAELVTEQLLAVLQEAVEGPPKPWSYFVDQEESLEATLGGLAAATASRPVGGTSIAAHVGHVVFALEASAGWIRGERLKRDWDSSWRVSMVDDAAWKQLREQLRARYDELRQAIQGRATSSAEALGGAIGAIAHVAYHLGAIRQKAAAGKGEGPAQAKA